MLGALTDEPYAVKNTFVELGKPLQRLSKSASWPPSTFAPPPPWSLAPASSKGSRSSWATPDFNARGVFAPEPAGSDCSGGSCTTAKLEALQQDLARDTDSSAEAGNREAPPARAETPPESDDAGSSGSLRTADSFEARPRRSGPVGLVEFTPLTPYAPARTAEPTLHPFDTRADPGSGSESSFASTDPFDERPRRSLNQAARVLVPFFAGALDKPCDSEDLCRWFHESQASPRKVEEDARLRGPGPQLKVTPLKPTATTLEVQASSVVGSPKSRRVNGSAKKQPPWGRSSLFATGHGAQSSQSSQSSGAGEGATTMMLHNVLSKPTTHARQVLFDKFAELGFTNDCMDYVYIPMREKKRGYPNGTGYMFVNLNTAELAASFCEAINGCNLAPSHAASGPSKTVLCTVASTQGVDANVEEFLSSKGEGLRNPVWVRRGAEWSRLFRD